MESFNRIDDDFHKYLIPEQVLSEFDYWLNALQKAPFMSPAKWDAEDAICEKFSRYMVD